LGRQFPALLLLLLAATSNVAWGSAFSIAEQGAKAAGMGTAYTAIADDGSAMYYNPAGIAFQAGTRLQMDAMAVVGLFRFFPSETQPGVVVPSNGYSGSVKPHFIPVASMYATRQMSPRLTLGFGIYLPFGLSANFTNFNDGDPAVTKYTGRFAGTRAALQSYWFQPTVAYKITPNSSIAVGIAFVHTHLFIESSFLNPQDDALTFGREAAKNVFPDFDKELAARSIARLLPEGRSRIAGTSNSPGFAAGYMWKSPRLKTNLGLNYRSPVVHHLKGQASFAFGSDYPLKKFLADDLLAKAFPTQSITGSFVTPGNYGVGIANSSLWNTTFSFDFRFQDFTRFSSVPLNFSQTEALNKDVRTPAEQRLIFDFRNSYQLAVGMEKPINPKLTARAGYWFDRSPVVDKSVGPLFPDANRHGFSVGATRKVGNAEFTLFYEGLKFVDRTTAVPANDIKYTNGDYRNFAHVFGGGLRFNIGTQAP
jgi:long-chain fatty acid transport protein